MKANQQYNLLLNMFKPHLKLLGYKYKKPMFYFSKGNNFGMISFQKSVTSTRNEIKFTINLAISSKVIFDHIQSGLKEFKPSSSNNCWSIRLGHLTEKRQDYWWIIDADTNIDILYLELKDYITRLAVPEIVKYIDDDSLIKLWSSGKCQGIPETNRVEYLGVLLKEAGKLTELEKVIIELEELSRLPRNKVALSYALKYLRSN